ncbi:MAG: CotH kinase family protein [Steroidobacteraceae bacterium]
MSLSTRSIALLGSLLMLVSPLTAQANQSAGVYDPSQLRGLNVELSEQDYQTIRYDETFDIEVPAVFWADGEAERFNATIRRKSATAIGDKVSYRMKIQSRTDDASVKTWRDIRTLSLENGDDQDVVREGLAWYLHRLAGTTDYQPGLAAWAELTLHVVVSGVDELGQPFSYVDERPQGVYVNVEMVDKQFLKNRGLWVSDQSWLYKQDDIGLPELKDWPLDDEVAEFPSPAYDALSYSPFQAEVQVRKRVVNPTPSDSVLQQDLEGWINMETLLRLGAVNAYTANPDELFNKGKNFYWADFSGTGDDRRLYFPWDLDSVIRGTSSGIYATVEQGRRKSTLSQHPYQSVILNHPTYRAQFNTIMQQLLDGPMSVTAVHAFLDQAEALLTPALLADPNAKIGSTPEAVAGYFSSLRAWIVDRHANVQSQLTANGPPAPRSW